VSGARENPVHQFDESDARQVTGKKWPDVIRSYLFSAAMATSFSGHGNEAEELLPV